MRAVLFDPWKRQFTLEDVPMPVVLDNHVLLRVETVGICGSDLHFIRHGIYANEAVREPQVLGHELSAKVEWISPSVKQSRLKPGLRVTVEPTVSCGKCEFCRAGRPNICPHHVFHGMPPTPGGLQEFMVLPPENVFPVPEGMDAETAMLAEPLSIAVHAKNISGIRKGETAVVLGCGPLGLGVVTVLIQAGVKVLLASDPLPWRAKLAQEFGAGEGLDDLEEVLPALGDVTQGRLADYVFEVAGTAEALVQAMDLVRPGGTLVYTGICPIPMEIEFTQARRKEMVWRWVRRTCNAFPETISLLQAGHYPSGKIITHRFPLEETAQAMRAADRYEDGIVKAMVRVLAE